MTLRVSVTTRLINPLFLFNVCDSVSVSVLHKLNRDGRTGNTICAVMFVQWIALSSGKVKKKKWRGRMRKEVLLKRKENTWIWNSSSRGENRLFSPLKVLCRWCPIFQQLKNFFSTPIFFIFLEKLSLHFVKLFLEIILRNNCSDKKNTGPKTRWIVSRQYSVYCAGWGLERGQFASLFSQELTGWSEPITIFLCYFKGWVGNKCYFVS